MAHDGGGREENFEVDEKLEGLRYVLELDEDVGRWN